MLATLEFSWRTVTDGVALGSIYALMAVGIGLVFGVLRLVNFAYGQLIMAGAYALALASLLSGRATPDGDCRVRAVLLRPLVPRLEADAPRAAAVGAVVKLDRHSTSRASSRS